MPDAGATVHRVRTAASTVPTDEPESGGTPARESTTLVLVTAQGGDETGLGARPAAPDAGWAPDGLRRAKLKVGRP